MQQEILSGNQSYILLSDLANELKIPAYRLRSWEVLYPFIKSFRDSAGRRFYDLQTVEIFKEISRLLYQEGRKNTEILTLISRRLAENSEISSPVQEKISEEKPAEKNEAAALQGLRNPPKESKTASGSVSDSGSFSAEKEKLQKGLHSLMRSLNKLGETIVSQQKV